MLTIHGASDDLIEIRGDWEDEIPYEGGERDDQHCTLALSDGTLLSVDYDGCWRFVVLIKGSLTMTRVDAEAEDKSGERPDGTPWYSDVLTFDGQVKWVAHAGPERCVTYKPLRRAR